MNKYLPALVLLHAVLNSSARSKKVMTIAVNDVRKTGKPKAEPEKHKNHEAIVFRTRMQEGDEAYMLRYYQLENDTMRYYGAVAVSKDDLTKADYSWNRDTISLHIYGGHGTKSVKFRAFGKGGTSNMIVDK